MGKSVKKIFVLLLVGIMLLTGCSKQKTTDSNANNKENVQETSKGKVTLRVSYNWTGSDPQAPYFEGMLKKFQEENKDTIELKLEGTPGEDYRTQVKVDASTDNLADVLTYWPGVVNLKPLKDADQILDVSEYLTHSKEIKREDFSDSFWDFYKIDGQHYGIPVSSFKGFFLANQELFEQYDLEIPTTWDEFMEVSKTFNDNGIIPLSMGSKGGQPSHLYISFLAYNFPNGFEETQNMMEDWKFDKETTLKAAQAIDDMRKNNIYPKDTIANGEWGPSLALYNEEKAAMIYEFPWMLGNVDKEVGEKSVFFDMPAYQGDTTETSKYTIGASNMGYVINKKSFEDEAKREAIVKLVDFMASDEMFSELAKGGMPPAKNVDIDSSTIDPLFARVLEYTKNQTPLSQHENFFPDASGFTAMIEGLDELFAGGLTPEDFVAKVQRALDEAK